MIRIVLMFFCVSVAQLSFLSGSSCTGENSVKSGPEQAANSEFKQMDKELRVIESKLVEGKPAGWKVSAMNPGLGDTQRYFFVDSKTGWAFNKELYKTEDGGETWSFMEVIKSEKELISNVIFTNANIGWLIEQPVAPNLAGVKNHLVSVLKTNNGGHSWSREMTLEGTVVTDFAFANLKVGWILGRKYFGVSPVMFENYLVITKDGGKSWNDVSSGLNSIILENQKDEKGLKSVFSVTLDKDEIILVTGDNQIIRSVDLGESWKSIAVLPHVDTFTTPVVKRIGIMGDKSHWFIEASHHYTALSSVTIELDAYWARYQLEDVYFSDGVVLTKDEVIVCGFRKKPNEKPLGIILHSLDGGQTWKTLTMNEKALNINHLQVLLGDQIKLWDDNGTIYTLSRTSSQ